MLPRRSVSCQRRQHDVGVAQVQRQLGEVGGPVHVDAVALGRLDGQPKAEAAGQERRPGAGRQHDLAGDERAARAEDADAVRRRLERERLRAGHDRRAGLRGQLGNGAREPQRIEVAVLREEEGPRELADQAREETPGLGGRHLVDARAEGARPLHVLGRRREARGRLEHLELAAVMEVPALAVARPRARRADARSPRAARAGRGRPPGPAPRSRRPGTATASAPARGSDGVRCRRGWTQSSIQRRP